MNEMNEMLCMSFCKKLFYNNNEWFKKALIRKKIKSFFKENSTSYISFGK